MKATTYTTITLVLLMLFSTIDMNAQNDVTYRWGTDSVKCVTNLSMYTTNYNQKNYDAALPYWRTAYEICPRSYQTLYSRGQEMFQAFFEETKDKAYLDTVIMILDQRLQYYEFNNKPRNDLRKLAVYAQYSNQLPELNMEAYSILKTYVEDTPQLADNQFLILYLNTIYSLMNSGELEQPQVVENHFKAMEIIESRLADNPSDANMLQLKTSAENMFRNSGLASCDNLIPIFTRQLEENPDDPELLGKVVSMLDESRCTDNDLYFTSVEALYQYEKTAASAYSLAEMHYARNNTEQAEKYYIEAVEMETEPGKKSAYLTKLATLELRADKLQMARDYSKQAIQHNPENGIAYYLIGSAYASAKISDDEFLNRTAMWAAVDYFEKALNAGLDANTEENAKQNIERCKSAFPSADDAFFESFYHEEGSAYTVGGWINERTTVRFRK